jgi:IS30 family transposase
LRRADIANISHERIYQSILANKQAGGTLYTHLRYANKKRYGTSDRRGQIKNRVSIGKRSPMVADRQHIGDWEGDTIIGKGHQQAIVTLVDRATRLIHIGTVTTKHANYSSNNYS